MRKRRRLSGFWFLLNESKINLVKILIQFSWHPKMVSNSGKSTPKKVKIFPNNPFLVFLVFKHIFYFHKGFNRKDDLNGLFHDFLKELTSLKVAGNH